MRLQILFSFISNNDVLDVNLRSVQLCDSYLPASAIVFTLSCFPLPYDSFPTIHHRSRDKKERVISRFREFCALIEITIFKSSKNRY